MPNTANAKYYHMTKPLPIANMSPNLLCMSKLEIGLIDVKVSSMSIANSNNSDNKINVQRQNSRYCLMR